MQGIDNFVEQETGTTGTGDLSLTSVNGGRDFSAAFTTGGTDEFFYAIWHPNVANEYEFGLGHLVDASTLSRDTVIDSSNSDSFVSFSSGTKKIICDVPAERVLDKNRLQGYLQSDGLVIANNSTNPNTDIDVSVGGNVWVHDPADESTGIVVDAPSSSPAIQLDTSGVGGRLNSTLDANQWYEPGVIASADGQLVDYVVWKPANRPASSGDLPTNYDYYRAMGTPGKTWWVRTDGSSNIYSFSHDKDGYITWDNSTLTNFSTLSGASPDGIENTIDISSQAPPAEKLNIKTSLDCDNGSGSANRFGLSSQSGFDVSLESMLYLRLDANSSGADAGELKNVRNQEIFANNSGGSISGFFGIRYVNWFKAVD